MENLILKYGSSNVEINIKTTSSINYLREKELDEITDLRAEFRKAVSVYPVGSEPLHKIIGSDDSVTIIISDITRFWMRQDLICRELTDYLKEVAGIPYKNMAILIALGSHRGQSENEIEKIVSKEVSQKVKVFCHDCMAEDLIYVGTTSRGTRVKVNPLAIGRKVIIISGTVHHLMSGFGGGRKSILPGISGKDTITHNHLFCLSPDSSCSSSLIGVGKTTNNPVNEDMLEAAAFVDPCFSINIISNTNAKHCRLVCGHWKTAWEESCNIVHATFGVPIEKKADVVIGSCGGYPKDLNLYQAIKTLINMSYAVKEGGTLIFLAECSEGGGSDDFFGWTKSLKTNSLDSDLRANFSIDGYIFYAGCEAISKCQVYMLTKISPEILSDMHIKAYSEIDELLKNVSFSKKEIYIMPSGGNSVPFLAVPEL